MVWAKRINWVIYTFFLSPTYDSMQGYYYAVVLKVPFFRPVASVPSGTCEKCKFWSPSLTLLNQKRRVGPEIHLTRFPGDSCLRRSAVLDDP